jgi:hypothetical protein
MPTGATARKTFLWPVFGSWSDGDARSQFQLLDPLTVFLRNNEKIRENWTPLFAVYRYDRRPESTRHSLLWNLLTLESGEDISGFSIGPLFSWAREQEQREGRILGGLIGWQRDPNDLRFTFFWTH